MRLYLCELLSVIKYAPHHSIFISVLWQCWFYCLVENACYRALPNL